MSGLAAMWGTGDAQTVRSLMHAAPHRGAVADVQTLGSGVAGVQRREEERGIGSAAIHVRPGVLVAFVGSFTRGDVALGAEQSAEEVADRFCDRGIEGVQERSGAYSFVLMEPDRLVAVRGPVGEVPLFWRVVDSVLVVASEPKMLFAESLPKARVDMETLLGVVANRPRALAKTCFEGVNRLVPGSTLVFDGGASVRRFWSPDRIEEDRGISFDQAAEELRSRLRASVARRLFEGDAVLLSGGLDSSAVTSQAAPLHLGRYGSPLTVVTAVYPSFPSVDERHFAVCVARAFGCRHVFVEPNPSPLDDMEHELRLHDGPASAPLGANLRQMLLGAKAEGITRTLDGEDADSLLGMELALVPALASAPRTLLRYIGFVRARDAISPTKTMRSLVLSPLLRSLPGGARTLAALRPTQVADWTERPLTERLAEPAVPGRWREVVARLVEIGALFFEEIERQGAFCGVQSEHPFADAEVVEFLLRLPASLVFHRGWPKAILRSACSSLPPAVRFRKGKPMFNDVFVAGTPEPGMLDLIRSGPKCLPWIRWDRIEQRVASGVGLTFPERRLLVRVLAADRFLSRMG